MGLKKRGDKIRIDLIEKLGKESVSTRAVYLEKVFLQERRMKGRDTILALMSSALLLLAFPRFNVEALAWVALVPLLHTLRGKGAGSAFLLGWICGLAFFMGQLYWVYSTLRVYGDISAAVSLLTMLALVVYLSFFFALFASIMGLWEKRLGAGGWLLVPLLWTSLEYVRENAFFMGFPWGSLGYSQYKNLLLIQAADITGVPGITFAVALVNSVVAHLIFVVTNPQEGITLRKRLTTPLITAVVVVTALYGYGGLRLWQVERTTRSLDTFKVAVVQGNIPQDIKWDYESTVPAIEKYKMLTLKAAARQPQLTVWPETAVPIFFQREGEIREEVLSVAREGKVHLLFGSPSYHYHDGGLGLYNSAFLLSPMGEELGRYDKRRLVPFGEYVPLKRLFFFVDKIVEGQGEFSRGRDVNLLTAEEVPMGALICFEVLFPDLSRKQAELGARLLVNITNDAWFGRTSAPYQHFSIGVFRAVENRLALVRAANTGISGFIAPSGEVLKSTKIFKDKWLIEDVPLARGSPTSYTRIGALFAWVVCGFTVFVLVRSRKSSSH